VRKTAVPSEDDVMAMLINPVYAVSINPDLEGKHEPIVPKERWIEANERLINDIGAEEWLRRLLAVLEGDFPASPDDPTIAYGYTHDV
jgi:hypothetical protein